MNDAEIAAIITALAAAAQRCEDATLRYCVGSGRSTKKAQARCEAVWGAKDVIEGAIRMLQQM